MAAPRTPTGLRKAERAAWRRLIVELGGADLLDPSDEPLLRALAVLIARGEDIRAALDGAPLLTTTARGGDTGNPLLGHERETIKEIRMLHERLTKLVAERGGAKKKPQSLSEMRRGLHVVKRQRGRRAAGA